MPAIKNSTVAKKKCEEILAKMNVAAKVTVLAEDPPTLNIGLENPGTLIGHRGDGVRALQHLLRLLLLRDGHELPAVVDIEGYRERQREQLEALAKRKAGEVRTSGQSAILSPMSSYERRLVHVALVDEDGIATESVGEGANRRVVVKQAE